MTDHDNVVVFIVLVDQGLSLFTHALLSILVVVSRVESCSVLL